MYNVTTQFNKDALNISRTVYLKLQIGNTTINSADILSLTFSEKECNENIELGTSNSQMLKFTFKKPSNLTVQGATVKAYISFDNSEWCPLGVFTVADYTNNDSTYEVTCYDAMAFLDETYVPTVSTPTTPYLIVNDICTQKSLTLDSSITFPTFTINTIYEDSIRSVLGYMAGLMGKNALINRDGELTFRWFTPIPDDPTSAICGTAILGQAIVGNEGSGKLTGNNVYEQGFEENGAVTISALVSGSGDNVISSGTGRSITFENPYMTQTQLNSIRTQILPFAYYGGAVKYRGNPAFEVGDIATVIIGESQYSVPIMAQDFDYDGGLYATLTSYALSDEKAVISQINPQRKQIERIVDAVMGDLEAVSNSLINSPTGYVQIGYRTDTSEKIISSIRIMNTPTVTPTTKGWVANLNGIGWSQDGFQTISKLGLDMANGQIYADNITANAVLSNHITAQNMDITGGSINITTASETADIIKLNGNSYYTEITPSGVSCTSPDVVSAHMNSDGFYGNIHTSNIAERTGGQGISVMSFGGSLYPMVDNLMDLGNDTYQWKIAHAKNFKVHTTTTVSNNSCGIGSVGGTYDNGYYLQRYSGSSKRHKNGIKELNKEWKEQIEKLYDIPVKRWKYNDNYLDENDELYQKETIGIIAEDLAEVMPSAIIHDNGNVDNYRDRDLLNALLYLVQEQKKEINELRGIINGHLENSDTL